MSLQEKIYYTFYSVCFFIALIAGIIGGFTGDSHTPPLTFGVEFLTLLIGFICFAVDAITHKPTKVHKIGLTSNGLLMLCVLIPALV